VKFTSIFGVDFSGARAAGRNIWLARLGPASGRRDLPSYELAELACLEDLCGTAEREPALTHLVERIAASDAALWALDFPFGLPIEIVEGGGWPGQFGFLAGCGEDAYGAGLLCLSRAQALGGPLHIRRLTDTEAKTPFDCYHYRIIYQTFYGMRDVLGPLRRQPATAILPFHYRRMAAARRVLVEACPTSTLKRLRLPHQNYKQPAGGRLTPKRLATRRAILAGLTRYVAVNDRQRRVIMRNGGGDALDASRRGRRPITPPSHATRATVEREGCLCEAAP
jgi:hypothetical protein